SLVSRTTPLSHLTPGNFRISPAPNSIYLFEISVRKETAMRLRSNELCPVHRSTSCCGRELLPKPKLIRIGVQRVEDPHHTRGYRELRSPGEMRKLLNRKIRQQAGICAICHEEFTDYNDVVPDHRNPKGMGGAWRDDHPDNIQATHWWCNGEKGSMRKDD